MLTASAKASIPRGRRNQYIPCWDADCEEALKDHRNATEREKPEKSDILMNILGDKRRERWEEVVYIVDFTHSSRKAWKTINKLTGQNNNPKPCPVSAKAVGSVLVANGKLTDRNHETRGHVHNVNAKIKEAAASQPASGDLSSQLSTKELLDAIFSLRNGKAPGIDKVHSEFLKILGLQSIEWLRSFLSDCLDKTSFSTIWRQA